MTDAPFPKFPKPVLGPDFQARLHKATQGMAEALRKYREKPSTREAAPRARLTAHIRHERAQGLTAVMDMGHKAWREVDDQPHLLESFIESTR